MGNVEGRYERYRLNIDLPAGSEHDVQMLMNNGRPVHAVVMVPGVGSVIVPPDAVTRVEPPLPPEPPVGTLVRDAEGRIYERQSYGIYERQSYGSTPEHTWMHLTSNGAGRGLRYTWAKVCESGPVTILVPMEPVELPFTVGGAGSGVLETVISAHSSAVQIGFMRGLASDLVRYFSAREARQLARALWAGADEVDRGGQP